MKRTYSSKAKAFTKRAKYAIKKRNYTPIPTKVRLGPQAFPKQLFNTLKYSDAPLLILSGTTGLGQHIFSCNGLYDPNITGTGNQPLYFDQLSAVYNHYTVLRSRIKVTFGATSAAAHVYSIVVEDDTSGAVSPIVASERPMSVSKMASPQNDGLTTLSLSWDAAQVFGPNPQAQDSLQGSAASNPSEQSYFIIQGYDTSLAGSTHTIYVQMEFDVVWDEFATTARS